MSRLKDLTAVWATPSKWTDDYFQDITDQTLSQSAEIQQWAMKLLHSAVPLFPKNKKQQAFVNSTKTLARYVLKTKTLPAKLDAEKILSNLISKAVELDMVRRVFRDRL